MYMSHQQMQDTTIPQKRAYVHHTEFTKPQRTEVDSRKRGLLSTVFQLA